MNRGGPGNLIVMRRKRRSLPSPPCGRQLRGMTMIELLLAMSATALIALAIASMLFARRRAAIWIEIFASWQCGRSC